MNCEGIWKVEITTPYGWERVGTAFMKGGQYLAASASHYSVGTYKQDGEDLEISAVITQYGDFRTLFGKKSVVNLQVKSKCKIEGDRIIGKSKAEGRKNSDILIRLTKLSELEH